MKAKVIIGMFLLFVLSACVIAIAILFMLMGCEAYHLAAPTAYEAYGNEGYVHLCRSSEEKRWLLTSVFPFIGSSLIWGYIGGFYVKNKESFNYRSIVDLCS